MIPLPSALRPWQKLLAMFPEDLRQSVGSMARILSLLLGPIPTSRGSDAGDPDGYDGLTRRGVHDRMLMSEWAMADGAPDEFLRRAVSGEQMFLRIARQEPSAPRCSCALFDAGPDQLGAPRVVQMATLIVLAQRAADAGASFQWGVLQKDELLQVLDEHAMFNFLEARTRERVGEQDLSRWIDRIGEAPGGPELWIIGGNRLAGLVKGRRLELLTITDTLDPASPTPRLAVRLSSRKHAPREAVLDTPPSKVAVRLLRNPFSISALASGLPTAPVALDANLLFSPDCRKLWARAESGALLTYSLPNSPRDRLAPPTAFTPPPGHQIVAVGQSRGNKRTQVITLSEVGYSLFVLSRKARGASSCHQLSCAQGLEPVSSHPGALGQLCHLGSSGIVFVDGAGRLLQAREGSVTLAAPHPHARVLAARNRVDGMLVLIALPDGSCLQVTARSESGRLTFSIDSPPWPPEQDARRALLGSSGLNATFAFQTGDGVWHVGDSGRLWEAILPGDTFVAGVMERSYSRVEVGLIVIDASRRKLGLQWEDGFQPIVTTADQIVSAVCSDGFRQLAYLTQPGSLGAWWFNSDPNSPDTSK